jgi:hypothetical protein
MNKGESATENYKKDFRAAYEFMARWQPCPSDLDAWKAAACDVGQVSAAGGNTPFLMDLLTAVYNEFDRQYKQNQEGEEKCG